MRPTCPTQGAAWVTVRPQPVQVRPMRPNIGGDWASAHFMFLLPKINYQLLPSKAGSLLNAYKAD
jgi:hypothetical protein